MSEEQRTRLPENPAGAVELGNDDLGRVAAAIGPADGHYITAKNCLTAHTQACGSCGVVVELQ